jgi:GH25 family lysozyme M1 (1,4-beta-N-acetylmuramidase)
MNPWRGIRVEKQRLTRVTAFSVWCLFLAGFPAQAARQLGIDVSNHQGAGINWSTVKNADGITFAWAKATEGFTFNDADFSINETNAKAAGVFIGAYHFARPDNQIGLAGADQEASHFWSIASPYIKGGNAYLMPMLDIEQDPVTLTAAGYTKTTLSQWVNRWCNDIKADAAAAGLNVTPVVYTYISFASAWLDSTVAQSWPLWMASYNGQNPQTGVPNATSPWQTGAWQFWQYNDTGVAPGDADVLNGDADVLKDYIVGSPGRFNDGTLIKTTASVKAWDSSAANGTFVTEPAGALGTVLQGPVYGNSYQRWQIRYADGHTGWSAEDFLNFPDATLPGDFNGDGTVNDADYVIWRKGESRNPNSTTDYNAWRQHFGQVGGAGVSVGGSVPEPAGVLLLSLAALLSIFGGRRRSATVVGQLPG